VFFGLYEVVGLPAGKKPSKSMEKYPKEENKIVVFLMHEGEGVAARFTTSVMSLQELRVMTHHCIGVYPHNHSMRYKIICSVP
jgi:hypothetical protein